MISEKELEELRDKLQFEEARADLMFECDCKLFYANVKWALDYIKNNELSGYPNYFNAKEYLLEALNPVLNELEDSDLRTREGIKEHLQNAGLFEAIVNKMIKDASQDLEEINIELNAFNFSFTPSETTIYFSPLNEYDKEEFIDTFKNSDSPLKEEIVEKHKALFKELGLYDELEQTNKYSYSNEVSEEQRNHRIKRR